MPKGRLADGSPIRKSSFSASYVGRVFEYCLLGLTDDRIGELLGVSGRQILRWKKQHLAFANAFDRGRDRADAKVAKALYKRAIGYSHPAVKIHVTKDGDVLKVPYIQHYPPDAQALSFYLTNRSRALWWNKPTAGLDLTASLEQLILAAVEKRAKREPKTIEHQPADESDSGSTEQPSAQHDR